MLKRICPRCGNGKDRSSSLCNKCYREDRAERVADRFWPKVQKTDGCWLWMGARNKRGYGNLYLSGKWINTHRLSYILHYGPIPDGMLVCHSCDNPQCVRPDHLWLGTDKDNSQDMARKGRDRNLHDVHPERIPRGAQHYEAKLTEQQVKDIRGISDLTPIIAKQLAHDLGVSYATIQDAYKHRTYRNVT